MPPRLDLVDAELARLRAACSTVSVTLVELEGDATWQLLRAGATTGRTAQRRAAAEAALGVLWAGHRQLAQLLADADAARAAVRADPDRRRLDALAALVLGESIELSDEQVPLAERTLFGHTRIVTRCTPAELLQACERAFDRVRPVLSEVAAAWRWQLERVDRCTAELTRLRATGQLPRDLDRTRAALGELAGRVAADPLAVTEAEFGAVEAGLARARSSVASAAEQQRAVDALLAEGPAGLAELDRLQGALAAAHEAAVGKIAEYPPAPPVPVDVAALGARLAEFAAAADPAGRAAAAPGLQLWRRELDAATSRVRAELDGAERPLRERSELRGRLEAYRAKAAAHGLAEHAQLSRMGERARDLLHVAPCDLAAARAAVNAYTNAVAAATTPTVRGESR